MSIYRVHVRYRPSSSFPQKDYVEADRMDISQGCLIFTDEEGETVAAYSSGHWVAVELRSKPESKK